MFYDYEFYPSLYYRPRYYPLYSNVYLNKSTRKGTLDDSDRLIAAFQPSYYVDDSYIPSYRTYYTPMYQRSPSIYSTISAYLPYRSSCNYLYSVPNYSSRPLYTSIPPSKMMSPPIFPESQMYAFTYGSDFNSMKQDIRSAASKLQEIRRPRASSVPRFERSSNCASLYDSDIDYYKFQRALSASTRLRSEEPSCRSIKLR